LGILEEIGLVSKKKEKKIADFDVLEHFMNKYAPLPPLQKFVSTLASPCEENSL
jgi:hypothetical protein